MEPQRPRLKRYTIDLGDKFDKLLTDLAQSKEITKSELIRRAVASYAYLEEERASGKRISVVDDASKTVKEVVLP